MWRSWVEVVPTERDRRHRALLQYLGVVGGGWLAGLLWLVGGETWIGAVLLVPCTVMLFLIVRGLRS